MTATEIIANAKERMKKTEDALQRELGGIRAGRANASLLDRLQVEIYHFGEHCLAQHQIYLR